MIEKLKRPWQEIDPEAIKKEVIRRYTEEYPKPEKEQKRKKKRRENNDDHGSQPQEGQEVGVGSNEDVKTKTNVGVDKNGNKDNSRDFWLDEINNKMFKRILNLYESIISGDEWKNKFEDFRDFIDFVGPMQRLLMEIKNLNIEGTKHVEKKRMKKLLEMSLKIMQELKSLFAEKNKSVIDISDIFDKNIGIIEVELPKYE